MSLIYRGQKAELSSFANTVETNRQGHFLGASYAMRTPEQPIIGSTPIMKYRGVNY